MIFELASTCNGFIDTFGVTPGKWLESAYIVLICGLYDGIGAAGARVYTGRFTFYFSDFNVGKCLAVLRTRHPKISTPNRIYRGICFRSKYKILYMWVYPR